MLSLACDRIQQQERQRGRELWSSAMVAARGHAERGEEKSWEWGGEVTLGRSGARAFALGGARSRAACGMEVGHASAMWGMLWCFAATQAKRRARGERRCGQGGHRIGPDLDRFRPRAQNEVCSPRPALHFSLRHSSHLSNIIVGNLISKVALSMH